MDINNFVNQFGKKFKHIFSKNLYPGFQIDLLHLRKLPLVTFIAIFWVASGKTFTQFSLGSFSLGAIMTGGTLVFLLIILTITLTRENRGLFSQLSFSDFKFQLPWLLLAFLLVGNLLFTLFFGKATLTGVQNVASFLILLVTELIVVISFSKDSVLMSWKALRLITTLVAFYIFVSQLFYGGIDRTTAISCLVLISILIPGRPENIFVRIAPYVLTLGILLSLSRTAFFLAMIILAFSVFRSEDKPGIRKLFLRLGINAIIFMLIVFFYGPMRERFIGGDAAINIGGVAITTEGRANLWSDLTSGNAKVPGKSQMPNSPVDETLTSESTSSLEKVGKEIAQEPLSQISLLTGHGAGAATSKIEIDYPGISLPHNEYLRYLYDYGFLGLFLFISGVLLFTFKTFREFIRTREPLHLSALLSLIALSTSALTDNPFVYIYAYLPMAYLIGLSLSSSRGKGK